jgi:hypothetical protein
MLLWASPVIAHSSEKEGGYFLYLSDQRIVTVELLDTTTLILNYINLSDNFVLIESTNIMVVDTDGQTYRSHLIQMDKRDEDGRIFRVTDLVEPRQYRGYDILGPFKYKAPPKVVYLRLGSFMLELAPLKSEEFESVSERVSRLDLSLSDSSLVVLDAGFSRGVGGLHRTGTVEGEAIEKLFPDSEIFPPVLLSNPSPNLLPRFRHLMDPVIVKVKVRITPQGGMIHSKVETGIDAELDSTALEVVRNSWDFLPAISGGEPVAAELVLRVVFRR